LKNHYFKTRFYAIALIAGFLLNACKEPDDIGLNIQPQGDMLNVEFSDTTSIEAYTVIDDSIITSSANLNLLGSIYDPIFGVVNASFATQLEPLSSNIHFGTNPVVDSMVLILAYNSYYGDTSVTSPPTVVKVYQLTGALPNNDSIYSNYAIQYDNNLELASYSFHPTPTTPYRIDPTNYAPQIRIRLNDNFAQSFINAADTNSTTGVYTSIAKFQEFLKGLYITTIPVTSISEGAICYFDLKKTQNASLVSRLNLYYHNSLDTIQLGFGVKLNSVKFNKFEHYNFNNASPLLKAQINGNKTLGDSLLYIQSMAGLSIKLKFPYLQNWYNKGKILINRAELVFSAEEIGTYLDDYYASTTLSLPGNDTLSHLYFLIDYYSSSFGGTYDKTKKEYHFNITRQIQSFLYNNNHKTGLYLTVSGRAVNASRVVIKGRHKNNNNFPGRLRLNLTYTKLY